MAKLLLAHARTDVVSARRLAETLRRAGHHPWLAEDTGRTGEPLSETLARGLQDTDAAVVCLSRSSVESGWTAFELGLVRQHAPARLRWHLIRFDPVSPPEDGADLRPIDFFPGENGWRSGVERLVPRLETGREPEAESSRSVPSRKHLPPRARPFIGRERELLWLRERLSSRTQAEHPARALLWGAPGEGKTVLAREYAESRAASYPGGLWWVHADAGPVRAFNRLLGELREHAPSALREAVARLPGATHPEDLARALLQTWEAHPDASLLILDGLPDGWEEEWALWLPGGQVVLLATCRSRPSKLFHDTSLWRLDSLSPDELRPWPELAGPEEDESRWRVLQGLLRGNATLVSAVSRLASASPGWRWEDFERELQRKGIAQPAESEAGAWAALDLVIEHFASNDRPRRLLEAAALFAADEALPVEWIGKIGLGEEGREVDEALRALASMSLLHVRDSHVFLSQTVRSRVRALAERSQWKRLVQYGVKWVAKWLATTLGSETPWEQVKSHRAHIEELLRVAEPFENLPAAAIAATCFAAYLASREEHTQAVTHFERALRIAEQPTNIPPPFLDEIRLRLARTLVHLGRDAARARSLMEQVVVSHATAGPVERADQLQLLSSLQFSTGSLADALVSIERAISIDESELEGNHPKFPIRLALRADLVALMGNRPKARALLEEALVIGERVLGAEPPEFVFLLTRLANLRYEQGDTPGALSLHERALHIEIGLGDAAHPQVAQRLARIATMAAALNDVERARVLVEGVLKACETTWEPSAPAWAELLPTLAEVFHKLGDLKTARQLLERVDSMNAGSAVTNVLTRAMTMLQLGLLCLDQEDVDTGKRYFADARSLLNALPEGHPARALLAVMRRTEPSQEEPAPEVGADALERALQLFHRTDVPDSARRAALQRALATAQEADDPTRGARALFLLAELEGRQGAWEQARTNAQQGLQLALRTGTPALVAEGYRLLGDTALHGSFYEEAQLSYEEAIRRQDELGEFQRAAQTRALLVTLLLQLGRLEDVHQHGRWLREHLSAPELTEEDRQDLREVLALVDRRLSRGNRSATDPSS